MERLISLQMAIDALKGLEFCHYMEFGEYIGEDTREVRLIRAEKAQDVLQNLPSAQPEQEREFIKLTVRDLNGRPYFSIIYLEVDKNGVGHDFEGYSSYDLDVISDYLKRYFGFGTSAQSEYKMDEWCTDCREYDQERHSCPRWNRVIRQTVEEYKAAQPEIVRCKDCIHHHYEKDEIPYCDRIDYGYGWKDDDYCSRAKRRKE